MATKKKATTEYLAGYIPANYVPVQIGSEQIKQIPPYPDAGIRYEGYAKVLGSNGIYELKRQETKTNTALYGGIAAGAQLLFTVPAGKTYYINKILIQHAAPSTVPTALLLSDGVTTATNVKFRVQLTDTSQETFYDFDGCPRGFKTAVYVYFDSALSALGFVGIHVFGWLEEN
jgi:hypothetical protein